jgi:hypothetical protein
LQVARREVALVVVEAHPQNGSSMALQFIHNRMFRTRFNVQEVNAGIFATRDNADAFAERHDRAERRSDRMSRV